MQVGKVNYVCSDEGELSIRVNHLGVKYLAYNSNRVLTLRNSSPPLKYMAGEWRQI